MRTRIARLAEGLGGRSDQVRLARHARRCSLCRRRARELGVEPLSTLTRVRARVAALLPLPWGLQGTGSLGSLIGERTAALAAIAAIGAGGAAVGVEQLGGGPDRRGADSERVVERPHAQPPAAPLPAPAGEARAEARRSPRAAHRDPIRRGATSSPPERLRSQDGVSPPPARGTSEPAAPASASDTQAPPPASPPAAPRLPDVRSVLPRLPSGAEAGALPPPQLPELPPVQPPQVPAPVGAGEAPGENVPPQVAQPVGSVVDGVGGAVDGALP